MKHSARRSLEAETQTQLDALLSAAAEALRSKNYPEFDNHLGSAAKLAPQDANVLHLKGLGLFDRKKPLEAFQFVQAAVAKHPKDAAKQHNLAAIQISLGQFDDAETRLRAAIALQPNYPEAFHTLAPIITFQRGDPLIGQMEALVLEHNFAPQDASFLCFALAKAYDDIDETDRAWSMLEQGNALMTSDYDMAAEDEILDQIQQTYTQDFIAEKSRSGHPSPAPVFVVGMPRSGTTLLERLLSEHPQVFGAGELVAIPSLGNLMSERMGVPPVRRGYAEAIPPAPPKHIFAAGQGYLDSARQDAQSWFDVLVDKMPDNSFNIGFIKCLLPEARFVHIMRHPLDTMLSIWFQRFNSVPYAFSIEHMAHHYRAYLDVMEHWRTALPGQLIEIRYENLVRDPAQAQSRLFELLDLPEEIVDMPSRSESQVQSTASRWQVRQPVYTTSQEKWRRYEAHLGPLIETMGGQKVLEAEIARQDALCILNQ